VSTRDNETQQWHKEYWRQDADGNHDHRLHVAQDGRHSNGTLLLATAAAIPCQKFKLQEETSLRYTSAVDQVQVIVSVFLN